MTTLQRRRLIALIQDEGYTVMEAALAVGLCYNTVYHALLRLHVPIPHRGWRKELKAQYAAYDRKTDELVALGTGAEVAHVCGITIGTLRTYVTRDKGKYQIVRIEEEEG